MSKLTEQDVAQFCASVTDRLVPNLFPADPRSDSNSNSKKPIYIAMDDVNKHFA